MIAKLMKKNVQLVDKYDVINQLNESKPRLLITAGAGDIDKLVQVIKEKMTLA
jgi:hypothetical protein